MDKPKRVFKNEIKYKISLNEEQKEAKRLILENQIVIITGRAGSGKSLVGAQTALDLLFKKEVSQILVTRAAIEVGRTLGYLSGDLSNKFNPYTEALQENLYKCYDSAKIDDLIKNDAIKGLPLQFIRGRTIDSDQILLVEEAQNMTKAEMLAVLTRLGKDTARIIINGDNAQQDISDGFNGLSYAIELSKHLPEIKWIKLKENHRSGLVGKILDYEYGE